MALMVDATPLQASTQNPVVLGLDQQTTPVNQTEIVVARTPQEKANLERFDELDFDAWNNRNWTLFSARQYLSYWNNLMRNKAW